MRLCKSGWCSRLSNFSPNGWVVLCLRGTPHKEKEADGEYAEALARGVAKAKDQFMRTPHRRGDGFPFCLCTDQVTFVSLSWFHLVVLISLYK